jgi:hypothetical protein
MRFQRWAFSDLTPWLAWLGPAAEMVKEQRRPARDAQPFQQVEQITSELISASLDYYRDVRDATSEAMFFHTYGTMFSLARTDGYTAPEVVRGDGERRDLPEVKAALASISKGGYAEALSRAGYLLRAKDKPLPLAWLQLRQELMEKYRNLLPNLPPEERRRISGMQELICYYEPAKAISTLPQLLSNSDDRRRFLDLLDSLVKDPQLNSRGSGVTPEQSEVVTRIREVLSNKEMLAAG